MSHLLTGSWKQIHSFQFINVRSTKLYGQLIDVGTVIVLIK